ncbi:hypothetical protein B0T19DRAFT_401878 [Cercophora scortea]|uniref:Uncharacterized protein n=1 Tax=Cercophora scortea TaxID=314031 RepID=A0AAE0IEQ9_9PEZI|nr:hypothetical protein B0T19DRAFT_401878 [Cercophora scortea]
MASTSLGLGLGRTHAPCALLQPSEEWKSVALCGLSPTAVMECAGRALSFWSYQMTNQILCQQQANKSLELHCAKIEQEVENIWNQGNTRIGALSAKMKDMELEEQALRRKCEDLRLSVAEKERKLVQSQELYNKLKQRVLLSQSPALSPEALRPRNSAEVDATLTDRLPPPSTHGNQGQGPLRGMGGGDRGGRTDYFPANTSYTRAQPNYNSITPQCKSYSKPASWNI